MTGTAGQPTAPHEWTTLVRGWHAAFWVMMGLAYVWLAVSSQLAGPRRLLGLVTVTVLVGAYVLLLQRSPGGSSPRTAPWRWGGYLTVAVVAAGLACGVDPALGMLLLVVYSQVWMFTPDVRTGALFATALTVSALLGFLSHEGFSLAGLRDLGPPMAISLLFSLLLGVWISRIIDQSRDRAELIAQLEAARAQLGEADHARGVMAERERLAQEIHDTLAQGYISIVMLAQAASAGLAKDRARVADRLAMIEEVARVNLAEARALVAAFSPVDLEGSTLPDALRRLTDRFAAQTGLTLDVDLAEGVAQLGPDQQVVLLRAVQEALTNVQRHAAACRVVVRLVVDAAGVQVEVGDDGVGFAAEASDGYGLAGMRGRVAQVGGELDVDTSVGGGTRVVVRLPLVPEAR